MFLRYINYIKLSAALIVSFFLLFLVSFGLIDSSPDFSDYHYFYSFKVEHFPFLKQRFEPFYYFGVYVSTEILQLSFYFFVFICTLFSLSMKVGLAYKIDNRKVFEFVFLYSCLSLIIFEVVGLRVSIAIAFLGYSIYCYARGNKRCFYFLMCISILFHYSMILCAILSLLLRYRDKVTAKHLFLILLLSFVSSSLVVKLLEAVNIHPLLNLYLKDSKNAPSLLSVYNLLILLVFTLGAFSYNAMSSIGKTFFFVSFGIFSVSISFYFAPVIYFRYIDVALYLMTYAIISTAAKNIVQIIFITFFFMFAVYKVMSILFFSPILNI